MLLFDQTEDDHNKVVSALVPVEARSAVRRLQKANRLTPSEAALVLDALKNKTEWIVERPISPKVLEAALVLIDRYVIRALDAVQLGSAIVARDLLSAPDMRFIASDKTLLEAARLEGFQTWDPCD
jgi:predicted nucleic acid-binding protein